MAWQVTDDDGVVDFYESKRDVISIIQTAMEDEDYLEAASNWGWRIKEVKEGQLVRTTEKTSGTT